MFRDDRNALRQQAESLRDELELTKSELARSGDERERRQRLERELAAAQAQIARIQAELRAGDPDTSPARSSKAPAILGGAALAMVLIVGLFVVGARETNDQAVPPETRPVPERPVDRGPVDLSPPEPPGEPAFPSQPWPPTEPAPPPEVSSYHRVRWDARVTQATGALGVGPGTRCEIVTEVMSRGETEQAGETEIVCGKISLYRSTDELSGMSSRSVHAKKVAEDHRYVFKYDDIGPRTGERSQVSIDTTARSASAWRETTPAFRIELRFDKAESRPGEKL